MIKQNSLSEQEMAAISDFVRTLHVRQHVNQATEYFRQALFVIEIARMTDEQFDIACKLARQLAHRGATELNEKLRAIPKNALELAQELGLVPKSVDTVDMMRYVSEAEAELRKLRKEKNTHA